MDWCSIIDIKTKNKENQQKKPARRRLFHIDEVAYSPSDMYNKINNFRP